MNARIRQHIRSNIYGLIAIFIVLGGTAYATHPGGDNTISSVDIINEEVRTADIGPAAVTIGRMAPNSINSGKVINNSLTGADIDESTLQAPSGSIGRWQGGTACDPESTTFIDCGFVTLNLSSQSRVLVTGAVGARPEGAGDDGHGGCRLATSLNTPLGASEVTVLVTNASLVNQGGGTIPLTAITPPLGPGSVDFGVECHEAQGAIQYHHIQVSAVALSPN